MLPCQLGKAHKSVFCSSLLGCRKRVAGKSLLILLLLSRGNLIYTSFRCFTVSQPDCWPPGGTESVITGAKSVFILFFVSTIFYVPVCDTYAKLRSAYNLKAWFLCQVFFLQSLATETPFRSWQLEKSLFRLLSAQSVCVEEAQGLDSFIFFSLWRHA